MTDAERIRQEYRDMKKHGFDLNQRYNDSIKVAEYLNGSGRETADGWIFHFKDSSKAVIKLHGVKIIR